MFFDKLFNKEKKIEQKEQDLEKIAQIKERMHPNASLGINKDLMQSNNNMSYKPLNNNFDQLKK